MLDASAKLALLTSLLLLPCAALGQTPSAVRARAKRRVLPASQPSRKAAYRVCLAKRADEKATPSIEPEWPRVELVARK